MKIEQTPSTTIIAEEGMLLKRRSDGHIAGEEVALGYNYYDAEVLMRYPYLEKPEDYEEIVKPDDWEEKPLVDDKARLRRVDELIVRNREEMNSLGFSDEEALEFKHWYPIWKKDKGYRVGDTAKQGNLFQCHGTLYRILEDHIIMEMYEPCEDTRHLYEKVQP